MNYNRSDMQFIKDVLIKFKSILLYFIRILLSAKSSKYENLAQRNDILRVKTQVYSNGSQKRFVGIKSDEESSVYKENNERPTPRSVNYHFTRQCNYKCGFCFHTATSSFVLPIEEAKRGLKMLRDAGMEKVNFSGGEPFIHRSGNFLGELVRYCKVDLGLPSVTIVSNGSLIKEVWFQKYGEFLDILAISVDSFDPEINSLIGRQHGSKQRHLETLNNVRDWCTKYTVAFKINTVVNVHNKDEDMAFYIRQLKPCRWKVFQCLLLSGENSGPDAIRNATTFVISDHEFEQFLYRHRFIAELVPESNQKMQNSYLILDERMRFLDCTGGGKTPSRSLLDVGVEDSINDSGFDEEMFLSRGGKYTWSKKDLNITDW